MSAATDCEQLKLRAAGMELVSTKDGRLNGICKRGHDTNLPENHYKRGKYIDCAACDRIKAAERRRRRWMAA